MRISDWSSDVCSSDLQMARRSPCRRCRSLGRPSDPCLLAPRCGERNVMRWSAVLPPRPGCPHRRLRHLLTRALPHGLAPGASTFRPWASASFVGARHISPCTLAAGAATAPRRALQEELGAAEWPLPGHMCAVGVVECGGEPLHLGLEGM